MSKKQKIDVVFDEEIMFNELIERILKEKPDSPIKLNKIKTEVSKKYNFKKIIKNVQIIAHANENNRERLVKILNIKPVREISGVTVVALFAKPHSCPHGKCIYCPGGPGSEFGDTPQSYTGKEPAALRAIRNNYDPYLQIFNRLEHYVINGHIPDKLELIFMGGTFLSLDKEYKEQFVNFVYKAICDFAEEFIYIDEQNNKKINYNKFNDFFEIKKDLNDVERQKRIHNRILNLKNKNIKNFKFEIKRAESSLIRPIGLTIETKPDWALESHCNEALEYGTTRFEVGVQTLYDDILKKVNRGHGIDETIKSFQIMKDMCFKINAHMMLGLWGSNEEKDLKSLINLFEDSKFRPDMLKIYPTLVVKGTPLYKLWEKGLYKDIDTKKAAEIIAKAYKYFPRYVRVMRVQRDIPTPQISGGVKNSNLRQYVEKEMRNLNIISKDIRAREVGFAILNKNKDLGEFKIKITKYDSSGGIDYFIEFVDENDIIAGFIRMRFPGKVGLRPEITEKTALIRELHVYGQTIPVGIKDDEKNKIQHQGFGKKLVLKAEEIAKENGYNKMVIISGIGVREYYAKLGYELEGPYMVKKL